VTIAVYGIQESGMKSSAERVRQDELIFASTAESHNHRLHLVWWILEFFLNDGE
jgi:hypothetical protein